MNWLKGKKTFLLSAIAVILAVLVAAGVITEDYSAEINLAAIGLIGAALRDGIKSEAANGKANDG
jgi:hypothetical protein